MMRKVLCGLMIGVLWGLTLPDTARAQLVPSFTLKGSVTAGRFVLLDWSPPDSSAHTYKVWRAQVTDPATVDTSVTLSNIATTTDTTLSDTLNVSAISYYLYVVKTQNALNQTIRSSYAVVRVHPPVDTVKITSKPSYRARVGILYTYQVTATSSNSTAVLKYKLLLWPGNMTIDSTTGLIQWTPATRGYKDVSVGVFSSKGGSELQSFSVSVGAGNGTVTGTVHDSATGKPVKYVFIRMYECNIGYHLGYWTTTDTTGSFTIHNVDSGLYIIHAYPFNPNYLPQWWAYARYRPAATKISVIDSPAVTNVTFSLLTDSVHLPIYRAQGTVTDTSGNPIRGALVVWARAEFALNGSVFDPTDSTHAEDSREALDPNNGLPTTDFDMDHVSRWVYRAFSDSLGKFSLRIPKGFYIVRASKPRYYRLFYNNQPNIMMSNIVALNSDTTNINFALRPLPPGLLGEISGTVMDSVSGRGIFARIIAYRQWWTAHDPVPYYRHYVVDSDSLGNYDLTALPPGIYRVLAMPLGQYIPSWYNNAEAEVIHWRQATAITISGNDVVDADINALPIPKSWAGYTSITGSITSSAPAGTAFPGGASFKTATPITFVTAALVYAVDASGGVAGYGLSDGAGNYTISGVAPGTYSVQLDAHDYSAVTMPGVSPTYDASNNAVPATQNISTSPDVTGIEAPAAAGTPTSYELDQNYPNPFNPTTQIRFTLPAAGPARLVIYNILGQEVATLFDGALPAGQHVMTWNGMSTSGRVVSSGVYFYRLTAGSFNATKKMLMLR